MMFLQKFFLLFYYWLLRLQSLLKLSLTRLVGCEACLCLRNKSKFCSTTQNYCLSLFNNFHLKAPGDTCYSEYSDPCPSYCIKISKSKYQLPVQIKEEIAVSLPLQPMGDFNFPQPLVPNIHQFVQFVFIAYHMLSFIK